MGVRAVTIYRATPARYVVRVTPLGGMSSLPAFAAEDPDEAIRFADEYVVKNPGAQAEVLDTRPDDNG